MYKKYLIRTRVVAVACVLAFTTMACGVAATGNAADTSVSATSSSEPQSAADKAESKTLESVIIMGASGKAVMMLIRKKRYMLQEMQQGQIIQLRSVNG